jgi:two-component system LytT family response regulator
MNILIIEDEAAAAQRMRKLLLAIDPTMVVVAELPTVVDSVQWFKDQGRADLVFMDVQLADGDSFEIFKQVDVPCPVVFTTAYDEYALNAFRVNALDYLLKPIRREDLALAVERARRTMVVRDLSSLDREAAPKTGGTPIKRFLIRYGEHFKVVEPEQIAYIHSLMKNTFLRTREGRDLPLEESLDKLESQLDPERFIRLNRQLIVHIHSIKELLAYSKSRVKVILEPPYGEDAIVSSERSAEFKRWLSGR